MKIRVLSTLVMAVGLSGSVWAAEPVDPAALGNLDAMLATCTELSPGNKAAYDGMRETMLGEQPADAVAAVVNSPDYKQAFDSAREQAKSETHESAVKGCAQLATALGPHARTSPNSTAGTRNSRSTRSVKSTPGAKVSSTPKSK